MGKVAPHEVGLRVFETVRCLECGEVYAKPTEGSTVDKNPGCPSCGYVGWLPISLPSVRRRSAAGPRRRRPVRSR